MEDALQQQQLARMIRLAPAIAMMMATALAAPQPASAENPLVAVLKEPVERTGRYLGAGYGDGYFACKGSGANVVRDLPPVSGRTVRRQQNFNRWSGKTFYDNFDRSNDIHPDRYRIRRDNGSCQCGTCDACATSEFDPNTPPYHNSLPANFRVEVPAATLTAPVHSHAAPNEPAAPTAAVPTLAPPIQPSSPQQDGSDNDPQSTESDDDAWSGQPAEEVPAGEAEQDLLPEIDDLPELEEIPAPSPSGRDEDNLTIHVDSTIEVDNDLLTERGWYLEAKAANRRAQMLAASSRAAQVTTAPKWTPPQPEWTPPQSVEPQSVASLINSGNLINSGSSSDSDPAVPATDPVVRAEPVVPSTPVEAKPDLETEVAPQPAEERIAQSPQQVPVTPRADSSRSANQPPAKIKWQNVEGHGRPIRTNPFVR